MIIMAYIIIGVLVTVGCTLVGYWDEWKYLKKFIKTNYRDLRAWGEQFVNILLWPVVLVALLWYVFDDYEVGLDETRF